MKRRILLCGGLLLAAAVVLLLRVLQRPLPPKPRTVEDVLAAIGPRVDLRWKVDFWRAGVAYPPKRLALVAFKEERRLDVFAGETENNLRQVRSYPILGASGGPGPKLREGDLQVPEGLYGIALLNPNSRYHLSLRVDYPNADDHRRAQVDGRDPATLGGDIMIHGSEASVGCLAMGDPAAEDLFVLAARTGPAAIDVVITPWDLRKKAAPADHRAQPIYPPIGEFLKKH